MSSLPNKGVSGIVLAGGRSRRLGRDKAVEPLGGQPLVRRVIGRVSQLCTETLVVVANLARGEALPLMDDNRVVADIYPDAGSLGGIFSGLSEAREGWGLVVACDMPFINLDLVKHMLTQREGVDAVVPVLEGRPEPTHALYSKACLEHIEPRLKANDLKISGFFEDVRVKYIPEKVVKSFDPDFLSFFNVNSPPDLERAQELVAQGW